MVQIEKCHALFRAGLWRQPIITAAKVAKISVLIDEDETELAVRVLHTAFGMDAVDEAA